MAKDIDGYTCLEDVLKTVRAVLIVDLAQDLGQMSFEYQEALQPDPPRLYIEGYLEPIGVRQKRSSIRQAFSVKCSFPYSAIWLKAVAAVQYFSELHPKIACISQSGQHLAW